MVEIQSMKNKRHILVFETEAGQLTVATDDIQEVSEQRWFNAFLNVPTAPARVAQRQAPVQQLPSFEEIDRLNEEADRRSIERARQEAHVAERNAQIRAEQAQQREPVRQTTVRPAAPRPVQQPAQPSSVTKEYMRIKPEEMMDDVWTKLNEAQKNEYMEFYGLSN